MYFCCSASKWWGQQFKKKKKKNENILQSNVQLKPLSLLSFCTCLKKKNPICQRLLNGKSHLLLLRELLTPGAVELSRIGWPVGPWGSHADPVFHQSQVCSPASPDNTALALLKGATCFQLHSVWHINNNNDGPL